MPMLRISQFMQQEEGAKPFESSLFRERDASASAEHLLKIGQHLLSLAVGEPSSPVYQMAQNVKSRQGAHPKLVKLATALHELPVLT